ncbi:RING/U-box superfamily protein [Euphorbia peplus]|nr:RING/U-box superfamily protein [Euphorbia peplus]
MASTSASRGSGAGGRIRNLASTLSGDNQSLLAEMRKALNMMKEIAVDMEKDNESRKVQELDNAVAELLEAYDNCGHHTSAISLVANAYEPQEELTDFEKLLEAEFQKIKSSSSASSNHPLLRQFREAVWKVHHEGQPMPGEEQEDIVMTSTQCILLNRVCPLSGKPIIEIAEPVRSMECKHIYDKETIMNYIGREKGRAVCPIAGCPKVLRADRVVCDAMLVVEIGEMRALNQETGRANVVEDFTALDDDEDE